MDNGPKAGQQASFDEAATTGGGALIESVCRVRVRLPVRRGKRNSQTRYREPRRMNGSALSRPSATNRSRIVMTLYRFCARARVSPAIATLVACLFGSVPASAAEAARKTVVLVHGAFA